MGQNSHRKYKEYKEAEKRNKRFPAFVTDLSVFNKKQEWIMQEQKDRENFNKEVEWINNHNNL